MIDSQLKDKVENPSDTDTKSIPILPLKGMVVFPYVVVPLMITDQKNARFVDDALMALKSITKEM